MIKLGIIYGGKSTEHEVSKTSAKCILDNLDKNKYDIYLIFIDKDGKWYEERNSNKIEIENIILYIKKLDVIFPVLHGKYGEDGTIQGLFEIANVNYVGCKVLASSICMDKMYTKMILEKADIPQVKSVYVKKYAENQNYIYIDEKLNEREVSLSELTNLIEKNIKYPIFVKPSNSGSSVGVSKAKNTDELKNGIEIASKYDVKILVEQGIIGKEVECAVLKDNKNNVETTEPGEIIAAGEFYSYDSKYNDKESKTLISARVTEEQKNTVKKLAEKAFKAVDATGLSRVDFFVEEGTGKVFLNEINTMPGFTGISMYPKLFEAYGYEYSKLLDKLIESSL